MPKFSDIKQFTRTGSYNVNVPWLSLERHLESWTREPPYLDLEPDFQREHVWTVTQQRAYIEYILRGGRSGRILYFNCPGWNIGEMGQMVIVDGKQRLQAVRHFLSNNFGVFGGNYFKDYTDILRPVKCDFIFSVNDLETRQEVLQWYLEMNSGGTPHTEGELDKVRNLLKAC